MFIGARNVHALAQQSGQAYRWFCFVCGLLTVYAVVTGFVMCAVLDSSRDFGFLHGLGAGLRLSVAGILALCAGILFITLKHSVLGRGWDSKR